MCAEVLVPNHIPSDYIFGACVSCMQSRAALLAVAPHLKVTIDPHFFFLEVHR